MSKTKTIESDSSKTKAADPGDVSKPSIAERKRAADLKGMKDSLFEKYEIIHQIQIELDLREAVSKYAIGVHVAEVVYETKTYGKGAVKQLAEALRRDKSTLVDYGKVAWTWNHQEFVELLKREGIREIGVSFSHLIEIAAWSDPAVREDWINRVLAEGLSIKALRQAMDQEIRESTAGSTKDAVDCKDEDDEEEPVTPAGVRRSIARLSSEVKSIPMKAKEWDARVFKPLEDDPDRINDAVINGLKQKREANNEAIKTLQDENRQIDEILKDAQQAAQDLAMDQMEGGEFNG